MLLTDWARELGINRQTLSARKKRGYTDEQTLTKPMNKQINNNK